MRCRFDTFFQRCRTVLVPNCLVSTLIYHDSLKHQRKLIIHNVNKERTILGKLYIFIKLQETDVVMFKNIILVKCSTCMYRV